LFAPFVKISAFSALLLVVYPVGWAAQPSADPGRRLDEP
jgi:hypothetical protein